MNSTIIDTWDSYLAIKQYVADYPSEFVVLDTETDSKSEKLAKLYGVAFCLDDHEAFYIPIRGQDTNNFWNAAQEADIATFLTNLAMTKKLIGHNILYDVLVINNNWNVDLTPFIYSDTILQKHMIDEERPFGLKEVAVKYLGEWANKAQQDMIASVKANGGKTTKDNFEMFKADTNTLGVYSCWDVLLTRKLFDIFEPRIVDEGLSDLFYKDEVMPLYKEVTIPMKKAGFTVDVEYFKNLNERISKEIIMLEKKTNEQIRELVAPFVTDKLNKNYPIKTSGLFPKMAAELISFELPKNKTGGITLAAKELGKLATPVAANQANLLNWLRGTEQLDENLALEVQQTLFFRDNPEATSVFSLNSNNDLKYVFFTKLNEKVLSKTDGGEPKVDIAFLESVMDKHEWVRTLVDYKKLSKLKSTYIEGILDRQIDGVIYSSFLQFGTTSGRYSSTDPNLQNLPRVKEDSDDVISPLVLEYVNGIKRGFIAPKGYLILNADYSQLEPRAFAEASGDKLLQQSFIDKLDLYGTIAVKVFKLDCTANEVKKKYPEFRQKAKVIALAVVYGAEAGRISQLMGVDYLAAQKIIDDYLNAFPGLKSFMSNANKSICENGFVATKLGRIRHVPEAKELYKLHGLKLLDKKWARAKGLSELSWKFKSMLNLGKNHPIQGIAAHIVNRSMIAATRAFKLANLDSYIVASVHDEVCCIVKEEHIKQAFDILKYCMENTLKLSIPLSTDPLIAKSWAEAK